MKVSCLIYTSLFVDCGGGMVFSIIVTMSFSGIDVQECDAMGASGSSYFDVTDFTLIGLHMLEISKSIFGKTSRFFGDGVEVTILENTDKSSIVDIS